MASCLCGCLRSWFLSLILSLWLSLLSPFCFCVSISDSIVLYYYCIASGTIWYCYGLLVVWLPAFLVSVTESVSIARSLSPPFFLCICVSVLYCIVLYCIVLYCIVLYCMVLQMKINRKSIEKFWISMKMNELQQEIIDFLLFSMQFNCFLLVSYWFLLFCIDLNVVQACTGAAWERPGRVRGLQMQGDAGGSRCRLKRLQRK